MKKIIFITLAVLLALTSCTSNTIKIGFIGPLTGDYANYGKLMTQAIKIAVEERNEAGGINGMKIELIAEDSEGAVEKANSAIEKLSSIDQVWGIVGAVFSSSSLAVAPTAEENQIVMISPSSTHKDLTDMGDYIFRDVVSDRLQAEVFARYVYRELGISEIAILFIKNDYSQGLAEGFKRFFEEEGGKIVAWESGVGGDKDFKTQLTKIKSLKPEALYLPNYVAEIAQMIEQANQLGIDAQILSSDGFSNPEIFELAGDLTKGVIFSGAANDDAASANTIKDKFAKKYNAEYNEDPDDFSLNSYDAANIIIDGIQQAYDKASDDDKTKLALDRSVIQKYIAALKGYKGVSGDITFATNGDVVKNIGIHTVENKEYKAIGTYTSVNGTLIEK